MADKKTVLDLLSDEIKDLYSAERQLTKAIPKMAKGSNDAKRSAFSVHQGDEQVLDLGLIGAGTRVEHYEMAGYMTAISLAQRIGQRDMVALLKESLSEEQTADQKLRTIGTGLLKGACGRTRERAGC